MGDLFDDLAARALGTAASLAPAVTPRFAPAVEEPELDDRTPLGVTTQETAAARPRAAPDGETGVRRAEELPRDRPPSMAPLAPADLDPRPRNVVAPTAVPAAGTPFDPGPPSDPRPRPRVEPGMAPAPEPEPEPLDVPEVAAAVGPADRAAHPDSEVSWTDAHDPAATDPQVTPIETRPPAPPSPVDDRGAPTPGREAPAAPAPHVTVSIGYVEVRAPARPAAPPPPRPAPRPQPRLSLQEYLRRESRR
jgi:hypothetical protein